MVDEHDDRIDIILSNSQKTAEYAENASSGFLGRLTKTPAAAAITMFIFFAVFILIVSFIAVGESEALIGMIGAYTSGSCP